MGSDLEKLDSPVAHVRSASPDQKAYLEDAATDGDAVFGVRREGEVDYKAMGWIQATIVMLKTIIALGVLAMPTVLSATGGLPGSLIILAIGLITTWTGHVVGLFKRNHPEVYSMDGVGYVLAGRCGREAYSVFYPMFMVFLCVFVDRRQSS